MNLVETETKLTKTKEFARARAQEKRAVISGYICNSSLIEPTDSYGKPKYNATIAFSADDEKTCSQIEKAMKTALEVKLSQFRKQGIDPKWEETINPIKTDDEFDGFYFLRATATDKPNIVDNERKPMNLTSEPVFGARANVSVLFRATRVEGVSRIYAILQNVQLIENKNYLEDINTFTADDDFDEIHDDEIE